MALHCVHLTTTAKHNKITEYLNTTMFGLNFKCEERKTPAYVICFIFSPKNTLLHSHSFLSRRQNKPLCPSVRLSDSILISIVLFSKTMYCMFFFLLLLAGSGCSQQQQQQHHNFSLTDSNVTIITITCLFQQEPINVRSTPISSDV